MCYSYYILLQRLTPGTFDKSNISHTIIKTCTVNRIYDNVNRTHSEAFMYNKVYNNHLCCTHSSTLLINRH